MISHCVVPIFIAECPWEVGCDPTHVCAQPDWDWSESGRMETTGASYSGKSVTWVGQTYNPAEYGAPVWSRSPHVKKVDAATNNSLRTISVCLKPTLVFQLPVLAGIAPAGLRRKAATIVLARKAVKHDWRILHDTTKNEVPPCRLKSR